MKRLILLALVLWAFPVNALTPTPTPMPGTPTPTTGPIPACCGDCNSDGLVSAAEYTTCSEIFLESTALAACQPCDCDGSGTVKVNELVTVGNNNSVGCPAIPGSGEKLYAVNPNDSVGIFYNQLRCQNASGTACLNLAILTADPSTPADGDMWLVDDGASDQRVCFSNGATSYCVAAVP